MKVVFIEALNIIMWITQFATKNLVRRLLSPNLRLPEVELEEARDRLVVAYKNCEAEPEKEEKKEEPEDVDMGGLFGDDDDY